MVQRLWNFSSCATASDPTVVDTCVMPDGFSATTKRNALQELSGTQSTTRSARSAGTSLDGSATGDQKVKKIIEGAMLRRTQQSVVK